MISIGSVNVSFVRCRKRCVAVAWASLHAACLSKPLASAGNGAVSEMSLV